MYTDFQYFSLGERPLSYHDPCFLVSFFIHTSNCSCSSASRGRSGTWWCWSCSGSSASHDGNNHPSCPDDVLPASCLHLWHHRLPQCHSYQVCLIFRSSYPTTRKPNSSLCSSQKPTPGDISGTKRAIIDPLVRDDICHKHHKQRLCKIIITRVKVHFMNVF